SNVQCRGHQERQTAGRAFLALRKIIPVSPVLVLPNNRGGRIALTAALVSAALSLSARPGGAGEGPWCAVISIGTGSGYEDCRYRSFEECRPNVLAGNRGFCNLNPRRAANPPGYAPRSKSRWRRQA